MSGEQSKGESENLNSQSMAGDNQGNNGEKLDPSSELPAVQEQGQPANAPKPKTDESGQASQPAKTPEGASPELKRISDDEIKSRLRAILAVADLNTATEKKIRKQIEEQLGYDISDKKQLIRSEIEAWLNQNDQDGSDEHEDNEEKDEKPVQKSKKRRGSGMGSKLSPALQEFLGCESMARTQVVKSLWDYIKSKNLQNPKDKRKIVLDERLSKLFKNPLTMFTINKQLSKHVFTKDAGGSDEGDENDDDDDDDDDEEDEDEKPARKQKAPAAKKQKTEGKPSGFQQPVKLSKELSEFVGASEMPRPQLTKHFWSYFKENNLQDPSDKRNIRCDNKLKQLFGVDEFTGFGLQKHLAPHIIK